MRKWADLDLTVTSPAEADAAMMDAEASAGPGDDPGTLLLAFRERFETRWRQSGGWRRAFLVPGGHVHTGRACGSIGLRTETLLLPEFSGWTEVQVVEKIGDRACTFCYPSAPVVKTGWIPDAERATEAARAERDRQRAEKEAVRAAKAITAPDGLPLRTRHGGLLRTERAAAQDLTDVMWWWHCSGPLRPGLVEEYAAEAQALAAALAHKRGTTPEHEIEQAHARARRRR